MFMNQTDIHKRGLSTTTVVSMGQIPHSIERVLVTTETCNFKQCLIPHLSLAIHKLIHHHSCIC